MGAQISGLRRPAATGKAVKYDVLMFKNSDTPRRGKLEITADDIVLHEKSRDAVVWPIRSIRRYGCDSQGFSFESGRRCVDGPAFYTFHSKQAERIFARVQATVEQIAQIDQAARIVDASSGRYVSPRGSRSVELPQSAVLQTGSSANQYLNCDSQGRFNGTAGMADGNFGSGDTLPQARTPDSPGIEYADLDLTAGEHLCAALRTPPRGSASDHALLHGTADGRLSPTTISGGIRRCDSTSVSYAIIDATKSKAAASLGRSPPS